MGSEWKTARIEEIAAPEPRALAMGPFGSNIKTDYFVTSGVPVIRGQNLNAERFNDLGFVYLTEEKADELAASNAFPGDLVFTHRGTLGQVGIIPSYAKYNRYVVSQSQMKLKCDSSKVDPMFVFYFFRSPQGQYALLSNTSTTGVPAISRPLTTLKSISIPAPPLPEQRSIAHILGSLDDKIELNRKMNRTLEEMARAIFKSWFIDFDPVRAKAEGRPTGLPDDIAALFPDSFEDSELGEIPKGWEVGKLGDVANNQRIMVKPSEQNPDTTYFGLADMPQGCICLDQWGTAEDATSAKASFIEGDILFGKLRPYFKKIGVAPCDGVCSSDILVIRPNRKQWFGYVLGMLTFDAFIDFTIAVSTGTRMPRVSWKAMAGYNVVLPPSYIAQLFNNTAELIVERIKASIYQSRTLASIRDTLLPKLISGEIRVPEAAREVEAVL